MGPDATWVRRLWGWMQERFPLGVYTVLVVLFHGSAVLVARELAGTGHIAPLAAGVAWLFFLHRLARVGWVAIALQAAIALYLGWLPLLAWAVAFAWSVPMRFEFGVGDWLGQHPVLYAVTHSPVVAGLALFLYAATGAPWEWAYLWHVALVSLASVGFELGRRIRRPDEEHAGVPSQATEIGQVGARALLAGVYVGVWMTLSGLLYALGLPDPWPPLIGLAAAVPGLATAVGRQPARRVEAGASLVMLGAFAACGSVALVLP